MTGRSLGRYQLLELLGRGGLAAVYRAYEPGLDRAVVITVLQEYWRQDPWALERFRREAELQSRLQHPGIVRVLDFGVVEAHPYVVKEYVQAESLRQVLERAGRRPLPLRPALRTVGQICAALGYAHALGLVHRDLKPANILLTPDGRAVLTDFGLARGKAESPAAAGLLGTPEYLPPEALSGQPEDARSDLYALGVVFYEMTTGRVPFEAETPLAVLLKHVHEAPPAPRRLNPDLPEAVERILLKALQKQREDRCQTAGEMERAVAAADQSLPDEAASTSEAGGGGVSISLQGRGDTSIGGDVVGRDKVTQIIQAAPSATQVLLEELKHVIGVLASDLERYDYSPAGAARYGAYYQSAEVLIGKLREYEEVNRAAANFLSRADQIHRQGGPAGLATTPAARAADQELSQLYHAVIAACGRALQKHFHAPG